MPKQYDANSYVLNEQLVSVERRLQQLYRPTRFRFLGPLITSAPTWADEIAVQHMTETGEIIPIGRDQTRYPMNSLEVSEEKFRIFKFGTGYGLRDDELERVERTGIDVSVAKPAINQRLAEQLLDDIAATGYTQASTVILRGLLNQTGITPFTTGLTGTWGDGATTALIILNDFELMLQAFREQSKDNYEPTHVVFPPSVWNILGRIRLSADNPRTTLQQLTADYPELTLVKWQKAETAGAAAVSRTCIFSGTPECVNMVIPQELTSKPPLRVHGGVEIAQEMKTAGVVSSQKEGIMYVDDLDAT